MELTAQARREIIEDLLDIQVFSTMNTLLKTRVSDNKTEINENSYKIDLTETELRSAKEHNASIRAIRTEEVDKIKEKMKGHLESIGEAQAKIETTQDEIQVIIDSISDKADMKAKEHKANELRRNIEITMANHKKELSFYHDHNDCPTCKQGIDHEFKESIVTEKDKKVGELKVGLVELSNKIKTYTDRLETISTLEDEIRDCNLKIGDRRATIKMSKSALISYKNELDTAEKDVEAIDTTKLNALNETLRSTQSDQEVLHKEKETLSVVQAILKDGGIKTRIIKQYIPVMNKLINTYLGAFDLFVDFQLDENFNEVIKSRFRDAFSYASFSEGEKLRITLSIMLAWRSVAKLRNSVSTNLLLLDETLDGALDAVGIENLIDQLHNLNADDNIFVISHRGLQFGDKFDSNITFQKVKNFSEIA